jgi:hypothetical protein
MAGGADITSPGRGMVTLTFTSALLFNGEIRLNAKSKPLTPIAANICFFIMSPPQTYEKEIFLLANSEIYPSHLLF